jgi:para-nitrobenzyl esterase
MRWNLVLATLTAAILLGAAPAVVLAATPAPLVRMQDGPVEGVVRDGGRVFTGIPFAAPPVGPLRFRPPQPPKKWTQTLSATKPIANCIQFSGGPPRGVQSEDCLYLNVFAPEAAPRGKPMPVMVWLFGGGLVGGGAQGFDGAKLAQNGVIVVVPNYRLGVLGMMMDASLDEPGALSGNYAIRDQQAALRWVQRNIYAFGGDPKNVTLFGQSSGASTVLMNLVSPAAKGLFHKAIVESSGGGTLYRREVVQAGVAKFVIKAVGCDAATDVAACLRAAPVSAFVDAKVPMSGSGEHAAEALGLVEDKQFLPMDTFDAFRTGQFNRVPVINGTNVTEGIAWVTGSERQLGRPLTEADLPALGHSEFFAAATDKVLAAYPVSQFRTPDEALMHAVTDFRQACPTDTARRALSAHVPVYGYEVTEPDPAQTPPDSKTTNLGNTPRHGTEIAYVFGGNGREAMASGRAAALSARFQRFWTNFAKFGSPDPTGKEWPRFTAANPVVIGLEEPPRLMKDFAERHNCAFMGQAEISDIQRVRTSR